jgi:hypothetical protein
MSATVLATGFPSGRTHPRALPNLLIALTVEVESHATYFPGSPASAARFAQMLSAPVSPLKAPVCVLEVVNTIFGAGEKEACTTVLLVRGKTQAPFPVQTVLSQPRKD